MASVRLSGIQAVVFDLDDTLYPERDFVFSGYRAAAHVLGDWIGASPSEIVARLESIYHGPARSRAFNQLLDELGSGDRQSEWVPQLIEIYRRHIPTLRLYPDAERAMKRWRSQARFGLISDGEAGVQEAKFRSLGLGNHIHAPIFTGQWGRAFWKPHPRAFLEIEKIFAASGSALVYVADNPAKDFGAPRQRGWQSVRVRREEGVYSGALPAPEGRPDYEVSTLDDITLNS